MIVLSIQSEILEFSCFVEKTNSWTYKAQVDFTLSKVGATKQEPFLRSIVVQFNYQNHHPRGHPRATLYY